MIRRHFSLALALALVGCLVARLSWAAEGVPLAPPALMHLSHVRASGAEHCLGPRELEAAIEARLGRRVFVPEHEADLLAEVHALHRAQGYVVRVTLRDRTHQKLGQRRLETRARHCSALDDSLALVLSLAADVRRPRAVAVESKAARPSEPAEVTALSTPIAVPAATHAPRLGVAFEPSVGLAFGLGLLPYVALGAQARLAVRAPGFWPIVVDATLWHDQRLGNEQGVRFGLGTVRLGVCPWQAALPPIEVSLCVDELLGRVSAEGFGFDEGDAADRWLAALGGGAQAKYALGQAFLSVSGSLLVPLVQRRYFYTDDDQVTLREEPGLLGVAALSVGLDL